MKQKYFKIDKCIYCGGEGQTDEHVIPLALSGTMVLNKASCEDCRDITSRCELNPLKDNWSEARAALDYPSRRRNFSKETYPIEVILKNGQEKTLYLNKEETFGLANFLEYLPPVFLSPRDYKKGVDIYATTLISFNPRYEEVIKKYDIKSIQYTVNYKKGGNFEKMVAKIAYCFVVAIWGIECFEEVFVLPALLNKKDDIGFWMGCDPLDKFIPLIGKVESANALKLGIFVKKDDSNRYVAVRLKFFAASDAPEYIVIVGKLKPGFIILDPLT